MNFTPISSVRSLVFTPIHRALGLPAGNISQSLIEQAVENGVEETADLDWKQHFYNPQKPKWDDEAAKDIAAMANSGGGWIVFGVAEDGERNAAFGISPVAWKAADEQRMRRVAYAKIGPPVVGLEFHAIPIDDTGNAGGAGNVIVVRIPDSHDAPHFARKGEDAFIAPRRNGPHTVFMSDREIERAFRERFQYVDDQERLLQDRFERASQALNPENGVFIALAALPLQPASLMPPPQQADVNELLRRKPIPELVYNPNSLLEWPSGEIVKGMRGWVIRNHRGDRYAFRRFLYDDATVLASYRLGGLEDREEARMHYPVGQPNHCRSTDVEAALINFITLLRSHAEDRQSHGGYRIRAGLVGIADQPIFIRTTEGQSNLLLDEEYVEPIVRFQQVTVELDPLSSPLDMLPQVNDLARDLINQGGIQYLKVMAEPNDHESHKSDKGEN